MVFFFSIYDITLYLFRCARFFYLLYFYLFIYHYKTRRTNSNAGVAVDCLNQFFSLVTHHPVGVNLRSALGIQRYHLEFAEVCNTNVKVLRTHIIDI